MGGGASLIHFLPGGVMSRRLTGMTGLTRPTLTHILRRMSKILLEDEEEGMTEEGM